ncbi:hypothetical protein MIND_01003000 [Mycena indigotica]|uniref:Uncharacterized protein n=1 Tax=Mycena indigotica TaxID=2126181 RepID=A0A8H6VUR2_9AGAR|nr:uncharacterized protein MIND_01003000 [Mycena indigotica]KAF7294662.1 hypothetical protein MIND_01003000 [Mycena indigotica]
MKRAHPDSQPTARKRVRTDAPVPESNDAVLRRPNITKLAPPRPFPTVPTSVSATGPRSAHKEGKNMICITRKTPLAAYLRRCKKVILEDGYKTLHLSAMGAAIPHLLQLSVALPPILPFSPSELHTEVSTNTVHVQDEINPDNEEDDVQYNTRGKSTLLVVIRIGDGHGPEVKTKSKVAKPRPATKSGGEGSGPVVFFEPDQEDMDI